MKRFKADGNSSWFDAMRPMSLKSQLIGVIVIATTIASVSAMGLMYLRLARDLTSMDDQILATRLQTVQSIFATRDNVDVLLDHEVHEYVEGLRPIFVRVLRPSGSSWAETPGMSEKLPVSHFPQPADIEAAALHLVTIAMATGGSARALSQKVAGHKAAGEAWLTIQIAIDTKQDYQLIADYRDSLPPILAMSILFAAVMGWFGAKLIAAPVKRMATVAQDIDAKALGARIDIRQVPSELRLLALTFNDMLARIEQSYTALEEFSGNIAHELRTPINNLALNAEVAISRERSVDEYRDMLESQLEECRIISRLVQDLLFLAREAGNDPQIERQWIDIAKELNIVRDYFESATADGQLRVSISCAPDLRAPLNRILFQRAIVNLMSNAIAHTPPNGHIRIDAVSSAKALNVSVADTGDGIAAEDIPHIFERFYRSSANRRMTTSRVGLGLSIVKKIAECHQGEVHIKSEVGSGTAVSLVLPLERSPQVSTST